MVFWFCSRYKDSSVSFIGDGAFLKVAWRDAERFVDLNQGGMSMLLFHLAFSFFASLASFAILASFAFFIFPFSYPCLCMRSYHDQWGRKHNQPSFLTGGF